MVSLDVQKAFDCVNHSILCSKLEFLGIDHRWFKSYLSNRRQVVCINGVTSPELINENGVPQGSLLGPLLYLCYCNDMEMSVDSKLILYADDSIILVAGKDPDTIARKLSGKIDSCNRWLIENKLSLHMGKCECMLFGSKRKCKRISNFSIECNGQVISSQKCVKYLGIELDQNLSGMNTVDDI